MFLEHLYAQSEQVLSEDFAGSGKKQEYCWGRTWGWKIRDLPVLNAAQSDGAGQEVPACSASPFLTDKASSY